MKLVLHARHMGQFLPNGDAFQQWSKQAGHQIVSRVPALHKQAASLSSSHLDRLYDVIARAASKGRISSPYDVQQVCQAMGKSQMRPRLHPAYDGFRLTNIGLVCR